MAYTFVKAQGGEVGNSLIEDDYLDVARKILAEAKERAIEQGNKIMEEAREVMNQERVKMMSQIKKDVATLSIEIAEKVIRKELSDKATQQSFVSELVADAKLN
jgi:F-type H+-transporting ATPase subunit b